MSMPREIIQESLLMPLKIAIVGTGKVARQNYVPFLASQPDVALGYYNRSLDKANEIAEEFGGEVFPTLDALAAWNPTTTMVLTSETCRYEIGAQLAEAGVRRLFFEKPLVAQAGQAHVTEEDYQKGKTLLKMAETRGCETAMIFNYRFFDQSIAAKNIASTRNFGQVIHITGLVHFACWSHCIDLIHYFAGNVAEVAALSGTIVRQGAGIEARDVTASLRMENGATGTLVGTAGMKSQHPMFEMVFTFENGRIHMRDLDGTLEVLDGSSQCQETYSLVRDRSRWDQYGNSFKKSLQAYLDSVRTEEAPPVPGIDGLRELQVEAAFKRSIAERRPVLVQEEFPLD
jgi:predicted dehydrogenase